MGGGMRLSDYRLEFSSATGLNDTDRLYYLLSIVSENDELEITMDSDDQEQINSIVDVLQNNEFEVSLKGDNDGYKCHIIAHRSH